MAISVALLTFDASSSTTSTYATASIAPGANKLLLVAVSSTRSDGAEINSITGLGLTWSRIDGEQVGSSPVRRVSFWRAETGGSAPTPGALTLNYGGTTPTSVLWSVAEVDSADLTAPIVQSKVVTGTGTTLTATFDSAPTAGNGIVSCTAIGAQDTITHGDGMTELAEDTIGGPNGALQTQWRASGAASVSSSWASSVPAIMVALEIKAAGGGGSAVTGSVSASVPRVTGSITGTTTVPAFTGALAATTALVTASIAGTTTVPTFAGDVDADLPRVTGSITGTTTAPTFTADLDGTLPAVTGTLAGEVTNPAGSAILNGTLPRVTGTIAGAVTAPTFTATLDATLPPLTGSLTGTATAPTGSATLAGTLPLILGNITGTVVNPDQRNVTVLSITEHQRQVAVTEHQRAVAVTEHQRVVTIEGAAMQLPREGREFYTLEIVTDPAVTAWEAHFGEVDEAGDEVWVAGTADGANTRWLLAGPDAELDAAVAVIDSNVEPKIRAIDNPEIIVRTAPAVYLT